MRCLVVLILACLAAIAAAQGGSVTLSGTLGQSTNVQANTATTINYGLPGVGATLVITTDSDTSVTLSLLAAASFTLDPTLSQYSIGSLASSAASVGYRLAISNSATIRSSTITSDILAASFLTQLTGNVGGVLYYDANTSGYVELAAPLTHANQAYFAAPYTGDYVFVARASTQPAAAMFNRAVAIAANTQTAIQLHSATTTRLVITQTVFAPSSFTATESTAAPSGSSASGLVRISSYFDLQSSSSSGIANVLQYTYTAADEARGDATAFAWYYYDETSGVWAQDGNSTVDASARVVSHASTHFSTWMVAAKSASAPAGGPSGSTSSSSATRAVLHTALLAALAIVGVSLA